MFRSFLLTVLALSIHSGAAFAASVQDLSALHGCWRGTSENGVLQETYLPVTGGMMFGADQLMDSSGKTLGWGSITISDVGSDVQFGYSDGGAAVALFRLTDFTVSSGSFSATFTNGATDNVNTVVLTLTDNQKLHIQLFGYGPAAGLDLKLDRVSNSADCSN